MTRAHTSSIAARCPNVIVYLATLGDGEAGVHDRDHQHLAPLQKLLQAELHGGSPRRKDGSGWRELHVVDQDAAVEDLIEREAEGEQ